MPHFVDVQIGQKIKQLRQARGLSQKDLAQQLRLTEDRVGDLETGEEQLSVRQLYDLAEIFDVAIAHFFEDFPPSEPPS